jgi:hypothetical protein
MVLPGWCQTATRKGSARHARARVSALVLAALGIGYACPTQRIRLACTAVTARICPSSRFAKLRSRWPTSRAPTPEYRRPQRPRDRIPGVLEPPFAGPLRMNLGRYPGNYLRVRKTIPRPSKTVLFGHRSPTNLNEQNVDWLAGVVRREYNAARSDP